MSDRYKHRAGTFVVPPVLAKQPAPKSICAWCHPVDPDAPLPPKEERVSHTICAEHASKQRAQMDAFRSRPFSRDTDGSIWYEQ